MSEQAHFGRLNSGKEWDTHFSQRNGDDAVVSIKLRDPNEVITQKDFLDLVVVAQSIAKRVVKPGSEFEVSALFSRPRGGYPKHVTLRVVKDNYQG
jgi:hypothetical protein